jgi:assimilatory nitrate reductase catalytic subunit
MIVCVCKGVTAGQVDQAIAEGASSLAALGALTGAGTDCGCCVKALARRACLRQSPPRREAGAEIDANP